MGDYKVYLGNIPDDTRDRDVEKLFKSYGKIRNVIIKVSWISMLRKVLFNDICDCSAMSKELTASVSLMT